MTHCARNGAAHNPQGHILAKDMAKVDCQSMCWCDRQWVWIRPTWRLVTQTWMVLHLNFVGPWDLFWTPALIHSCDHARPTLVAQQHVTCWRSMRLPVTLNDFAWFAQLTIICSLALCCCLQMCSAGSCRVSPAPSTMPGCCGGRGLPESIADKPSPKFHPVYLVSVCLPQNVNWLCSNSCGNRCMFSIVFQLGSSRSLAEFRSHPSYIFLP